MVKRKIQKSLIDKSSQKKRAQAQVTRVAAVGVGDLWEEGLVEAVGRPKNKMHGKNKQMMIERTSKALKAANVPAGAQSYNPVPEQHQKAVDHTVALLQRKEAQMKAIADKVKVDPIVKKTIVGDDLTGTSWSEEIVGEPAPPTKPSKRKTRQQKNRRARQLLADKLKKRVAQRKAIVRDADRIDEIMSEINTQRAESAAKQSEKKASRMRKLTTRIGRKRYKPGVMDIQATDNIRPSLRQQGDVLNSVRDPIKTRFESFQARNIIPATTALVRRKPRRPTKYFLVTRHDEQA
eukprot:TRINITY_DN17468_c0_g1_i1.p1 TRINITY_DN17468_c0_g1~~TRINITY_DN17468_c0_g1_i1.p1  ORF type:complete len:293 (+),score=37.48 TRINITY_DN17468_c0_g1_i1:71-949(+)